MIKITFRYPTDKLNIAGDFTQWEAVPMTKNYIADEWEFEIKKEKIKCAEGVSLSLHFKFIDQDGKWFTNNKFAKEFDNEGNENNVLYLNDIFNEQPSSDNDSEEITSFKLNPRNVSDIVLKPLDVNTVTTNFNDMLESDLVPQNSVHNYKSLPIEESERDEVFIQDGTTKFDVILDSEDVKQIRDENLNSEKIQIIDDDANLEEVEEIKVEIIESVEMEEKELCIEHETMKANESLSLKEDQNIDDILPLSEIEEAKIKTLELREIKKVKGCIQHKLIKVDANLNLKEDRILDDELSLEDIEELNIKTLDLEETEKRNDSTQHESIGVSRNLNLKEDQGVNILPLQEIEGITSCIHENFEHNRSLSSKEKCLTSNNILSIREVEPTKVETCGLTEVDQIIDGMQEGFIKLDETLPLGEVKQMEDCIQNKDIEVDSNVNNDRPGTALTMKTDSDDFKSFLQKIIAFFNTLISSWLGFSKGKQKE